MKWERLARRLVGVSRRGIKIVTQGEVEERNRVRIPQNTLKSTAWHSKVWEEWALEQNSLPLKQRKADDFTVVPNCDLELCFWLSKFVLEIKTNDRSEYPPNTHYQICAGLQRLLERVVCHSWTFSEIRDIDYSETPLIRE